MTTDRVPEGRDREVLVDEPGTVTDRTVRQESGAERAVRGARPLNSRISGAPVWSGFAVGFGTWVLFEIILLATGLIGIAVAPGGAVESTQWWWSFAAAIVALGLGGMVAGASSVWKGALDGTLQGLTVWGIAVIALLLLSAFGAGVSFGAFGQLFNTSRAASAGANVPVQAIEAARNAATYAGITLAATAAAAAVGGAMGAKVWPRASDRRPADV